MKPEQPKYMGYRAEDYATPWAKYFSEEMAPIPPHVARGLEQSPFAAGSLPALDRAAEMARDGYAEVETGYAYAPDGSLNVHVLTKLPRVAPRMWDWWFGWHGSHSNRYKLWHPLAHKSAQWADGREDLPEYVGRTSLIHEYIGKNLAKASIRFIPPAELGFNAPANPDKEVFICARVGYTQVPLDFGWLLHHVRATDEGAEMRSRFWMGGQHIQFRLPGAPPKMLAKVLQKVVPMPEQQAIDLLTHCAQEMNHLAKFLPEIYAEFQQE